MPEKALTSTYEKREHLNGALKVQRQIDKLKDKLKDLKCTGGIRGTTLSDMPRGGDSLSIFDMISEIQGDIDRLEEEKLLEATLVKRQIDKFCLDDRDERLLVFRYVDCYRWRDVATLIGVTEKHAFKIEREILNIAFNDTT